ncbi:MAG: fibronectin type III domain-containing protein [Flavobacteriales bacterium]
MTAFFNVKLGLDGLTSKALVEKGRNCVDMLSPNASFTFPAGFLASVSTACDALEQADQEILFNGGKVTFQMKRAAEKQLITLLRVLAGIIQGQAAGDEAKILSAGFDVKRFGPPIISLSKPNDLRYIPTEALNTVEVRWDVTDNAINYKVMVSLSDPATSDKWEVVGFPSKAAFTIEGLPTATKVWVRVQAIGRKGLVSPMSQVIMAVAA